MSSQVDAVRANAAEHLILIARNLRADGDLPLVLLSEDGVSDYPITLAGELELIALQLDWDGVTERCRSEPESSV